MSTHSIGINEELTKIIFQLSSKFIKYTPYLFFLPLLCAYVIMHYENTPMQYTAIFHGCKNDNF